MLLFIYTYFPLFSHSFPSGIPLLLYYLSVSALCTISLSPSFLTSGDNALQPDYVRVVKLPENASFAKKGTALLVRTTSP